MKNKKGFTLIELLAVIIILGVLMLIAVPSVTEYIGNARKKAYITTAQQYVGATAIKVNSLDLPISDPNTTYYVPISSINLERGGKSPYGEWKDAYVVVTFDGTKYNYYWTSLDDKGNAILLADSNKLTNDSIVRNIESLDLSVGVGDRDNIVIFNPDGTTQPPIPAISFIEEGGSIAEGTTEVPRPVITLNGDATIEVSFGSTYTDLGATATDSTDGDITASIVVTNEVDTNTLGEQYVRYNVTNSKGVGAIEVVRTVTVIVISDPHYVASEGVNAPAMVDGLTAIKWNSTSSTWDAVADPVNDTSWYNYANKEWANAKTNDGSMWVWIPRYSYQIATGYHTSTAGTINVKFLKGRTNTASDESTVDTTPTYSGSSQTNYVKHPAFTFGTTELTGIWVAKFEASGTTGSLDFKPNVVSLRSVTVGSFFTAARNMETNSKYGWGLASGLNTTTGVFTTDTNNVDTHMIKEREWGAAAYLSKSSYGINGEVYINPSSSYVTGRGGAAESQVGTADALGSASATLYGYDGKSCSTKTGYVCTGTAQSVYGVSSSTTGTIYGIYDMAGGSAEYTMGNYNNTAGTSGITSPSSINSKYNDVYSTTGAGYDPANYGDAVYETSSAGTGVTAWYGGNSVKVDAGKPWYNRGGYYDDATLAGVFYFAGFTGAAFAPYSSRVVLLVDTEL